MLTREPDFVKIRAICYERMKGLFLGQRRFVVIAHAIATALKNKYDIQDFCVYTTVRSNLSFLKNQSDIKYRAILLDEDIHDLYKNEPLDLTYLHWLEQEYGIPNLWPYLTIDRILIYNQFLREYPYDTTQYTHEEMMRVLQVTAQQIIKLFDEEKPDFVFLPAIASLGSLLLYHVAKKRNIPVLITIVGRVGDLLLLSENYHDNSWADKIFAQLQNGQIVNQWSDKAKKILADFRDEPVPYYAEESPDKKATSRQKQFKFMVPRYAGKSIAWFFALSWQYVKNYCHHDYDEINPLYYLLDRLKRKTRCLIGYDSFFDKPNFDEDYAFYPLQLDPEMTTMLYAPFFADQAYVIKQCARSLPLGFKLYVKEHPAMVGYRPRSYYRELKKIPNVKIINPQTKSFELIKNCRLIMTVTSTVGWEALFLKKPVVTLGDVFYNKLSMVKCCKTIEQLPYTVKEQLENFHFNEDELVNYLSAMLADGIDIPFISLWEKEFDNTEKTKAYSEKIADLIIKKLNYNSSNN